MAYEKQTWQTGDIITALKLNHMEDGIESAPGYHVETENLGTLIPQQTVTTAELVEGAGDFVGLITLTNMEGLTEPPESLQVVFNGTSYNCPKSESEDLLYGAQYDDTLDGMDWSEYPFAIVLSSVESGEIATESEGTYTVSADAVSPQLVIDPEFEEAVNSIANEKVVCYVGADPQDSESKHIYKNGQALKYSEAKYLYERGKLVVSGYFVSQVVQLGDNSYRAYLYAFSTSATNVTTVQEVIFSTASEDGTLTFHDGGK